MSRVYRILNVLFRNPRECFVFSKRICGLFKNNINGLVHCGNFKWRACHVFTTSTGMSVNNLTTWWRGFQISTQMKIEIFQLFNFFSKWVTEWNQFLIRHQCHHSFVRDVRENNFEFWNRQPFHHHVSDKSHIWIVEVHNLTISLDYSNENWNLMAK